MRSNAVAWNPTRAFQLTLANEDYKCVRSDEINSTRLNTTFDLVLLTLFSLFLLVVFSSLYTYDMRQLETALQVHTDHVAAGDALF